MDIAGKAFIVTGGASGLGEGTARMLAAAGGRVVVADMQADKGAAVAREIGGVFVRCDVTQEADGEAAVRAATGLGKLMGLVNCAGIATAERTVGRSGPHALAGFTRTVTVNLIGTFNMIRLAAQAMSVNDPEPTGERGCIISTASVAAYDGQIGQAAYSASKGGVVGMTLPIARDLAQLGFALCATRGTAAYLRAHGLDVLVPATRQVEDDHGAGWKIREVPSHPRGRM